MPDRRSSIEYDLGPHNVGVCVKFLNILLAQI